MMKKNKTGKRNLWKKVKSGFLSALVLFGAMGITAATSTEVVYAAERNDAYSANVFKVIQDLTGTDVSNSATWSAQKAIGGTGYGYNDRRAYGSDGASSDVLLSTGDYNGILHNYTHDCVSSSYIVVGRALGLTGENVFDYFSHYIRYELSNGNTGGATKAQVITDYNSAIATATTGDIIVYSGDGTTNNLSGSNGKHMCVVLGWNGDTLYSFDYSSYLNGGSIQKVSSYIDIGGGKKGYFAELYHIPTFNKDITVNVTKTSALPNCTTNNSLYSLSGAVFGVYTSADCSDASKLGEITTDASGKGSKTFTVSGGVDKIYTKELKAPTSYEITETGYKVSDASGTVNVSFSDMPITDPAEIWIYKIDGEGKTNVASLEGAEFTFSYYDTFANSLDDLNGLTPTATWTIKTLKDSNGSYIAKLDDEHKVSGDDWYRNANGAISFLRGTVTLKETKAAADYTVDGGYLNAANGSISAYSSDTVMFTITKSGDAVSFFVGNKTTKNENPIRGGYAVTKKDATTGTTAQGDATLAGAEFDLYYIGGGVDGTGTYGMKIDTDNDGLGDGTEYLPSTETSIDHIVIGEDGTYTSSSTYLAIGKYKLVETKAPTGYLTTDYSGATVTKEFVVDSDKTTVEIDVEDYVGLGSFKIQKNDNELTSSYHQGDTDFTTTFEIKNASANPVTVLGKTYATGEAIDIEGDGSLTFTTNSEGFYQATEKLLPYGTYTITEVTAPTGYKAEGTLTTTFSIREHGEVVDLTHKIYNDIKRGGFKIQKNDIDYATRSQGDTNLKTTFELVNSSSYDVLVDVNDDGKLDTATERFAPNAVISTLTTDETGYYETADDYLPYGTYTINEIVAPTGYTKEGTITSTFSIRSDKEMIDITQKIENRVDYGKFSVYKVAAESTSDWAKPEANVEFTAVLSSKIGEGKAFATFEDAYNTIADAGKSGDIKDEDGNILLTVHEYAVLVTDKDGKATSNDLAYGTYTIKQTSHVEETVDVTSEATFEVKEDGQETIPYTATNTPTKYRLHMVKLDADTQKHVSLNSAEFKVFQLTDKNGNEVNKYVTQKVGLFKYDTFKTASDNSGLVVVNAVTGTWYDSNETAGEVTTPLELDAGTYRIEEVKTPEGYLELDEPIEFEIKESTITRRDEDNDAIIEIKIENNKPHGTLEITKDLENYDYDQSLLGDEIDYSSIQFELRATEDIIDPADGTVITKEGELAKDVYGNEVGSITLSTDGTATVEDLPMGSYALKETVVPDGLVLDETNHTVTFTQEDEKASHKTYKVVFDDEAETTDWLEGMKVQTAEPTIINKPTKVEPMKLDTKLNAVKGAKLVIKDSNGNVVLDADGNGLTWTSTDKAYKIEGLTAGETYTLEEVETPKGYVKAADVTFTVNADGTVTEVNMIDKRVQFSKIDAGGAEVEGAEMTVTDKETGETVDFWTSTKDVHYIENLEEGKTYVLHEVVAPEGYAKASDIEFTVTGEEDGVKVDQHIEMVDKIVSISKKDITGEDEVEGATLKITDEDSNEVDTWVSGKEAHKVSGLEVGKTYTLHEESAPDGYYYATDITFTVTDDGIDQIVEMVDEPIHYQIKKVDEDGNTVAGVTLTLTDITDAEKPVEIELPNDGVTTTEPIDLYKVLIAEHTYKLVETELVGGVYKATDIQFTVSKTGTSEVYTITMVDELTGVNVLKTDDTGKAIAGAKMRIIEAIDNGDGTYSEGDVVYEWTSTGKAEDVSKYVKGDAYYFLQEVEAPFGYNMQTTTDKDGNEVPVSTLFKVTGTDEEAQVLTVINARKHFYVSAVKIDANDNKTLLKGAEITVYNKADGSIAKDVYGNDAVLVTDGKGNCVFELPYSPEGYYIMETKAPTGYDLNPNKFDVELTEDYDFAANNPIVIKVADSLLPIEESQSNISGKAVPIAVGCVGAGVVIAGVAIAKRKKDEENSDEEDTSSKTE